MRIRESILKPALLSGVLLMLLFSCTPGDKKSTDTEQADSSRTAASPGDSIDVPTFEIAVKLTGRAEKKLKKDHETIIVDASFSGIPTDTTRAEYQQEGQIPVGSHKIELSEPGIARFEGVKMSKADFESLANKDYEVLINIYSGRRSSPLNLLNCDILQEPISKIRGDKRVLKGDLLE